MPMTINDHEMTKIHLPSSSPSNLISSVLSRFAIMIPRHIPYLALCLLHTSTAFIQQTHLSPAAWTQPSPTHLNAVWSDMKAVHDYQNFLASGKQEVELTRDQPSVIVRSSAGDAALAECLAIMGMGDDCILTPEQEMPNAIGGSQDFPIYITLPPYELEAFLKNLPESYKDKTEDFVFFSGGPSYGNIEDLLKDRGYCRDSMTQCLVSGMQITRTRRPIDLHVNLGKTPNDEDKLAGECTACGKWRGSIAQRMERSNVLCSTDFYREWRRKMWERSASDAILSLVGSVRDTPTTVGEVASYYGEEASDILWDVSNQLRGWKAVTLLFGFEERIYGFAEAAAKDDPCILSADMFPYIHGSFVFLQSQPFVEYLQYAQSEKGLLQGVELPSVDKEYTSVMRPGNLRADGVV